MPLNADKAMEQIQMLLDQAQASLAPEDYTEFLDFVAAEVEQREMILKEAGAGFAASDEDSGEGGCA